jgi:uncharacterized protein YktA (UPF0223 family)
MMDKALEGLLLDIGVTDREIDIILQKITNAEQLPLKQIDIIILYENYLRYREIAKWKKENRKLDEKELRVVTIINEKLETYGLNKYIIGG